MNIPWVSKEFPYHCSRSPFPKSRNQIHVTSTFTILNAESLPGCSEIAPFIDEPFPQLPFQLQVGELLIALAADLGIVADHMR